MPQIHRRYSNSEFIGRVIDRAYARRLADVRKRSTGRPFVGYRGKSDLCYAYSVDTGEFYAGYSSIAGGIYGMFGFLGEDNKHNKNLGAPETIEDRRLPSRRLDRLVAVLGESAKTDPHELGRKVANCAEACALSIALSYDEDLENLFFISFYPGDGLHRRVDSQRMPVPKSPCPNCKTWLKYAYGYWDGKLKFCNEE
jgi:hypothetical protein